MLLNLITLKAREIITRITEIHPVLAAKDTIIVSLELLTRKTNSAHNLLLSKDFLVEKISDETNLIGKAHRSDIVEFFLVGDVDLTTRDHHIDVVVFFIELRNNFDDVSHNKTPFPFDSYNIKNNKGRKYKISILCVTVSLTTYRPDKQYQAWRQSRRKTLHQRELRG